MFRYRRKKQEKEQPDKDKGQKQPAPPAKLSQAEKRKFLHLATQNLVKILVTQYNIDSQEVAFAFIVSGLALRAAYNHVMSNPAAFIPNAEEEMKKLDKNIRESLK